MKTNASRHGHWGSIGAVLEPRRQRQSETTKKNGQENTGAKLNQPRETEWRRPLAQKQRFADACAPASTQRPQAAARPGAKRARTGKTRRTATHQKKKKRKRPARFDRIGRCQLGRAPSAQPAADRAACPVRAPRRRNLNGAQNTFAPMTLHPWSFLLDPARDPILAFGAKRRSRPESPAIRPTRAGMPSGASLPKVFGPPDFSQGGATDNRLVSLATIAPGSTQKGRRTEHFAYFAAAHR